MSICGGRMMAMAWMRMPGQTWPGAAAGFLGMWTVMMIAMMLPAMTPALAGYRPALGARLSVAYFGVWMLFGFAVYPLGLALAELAMREPALARGVPALGGLVLLIAGLLQLSAWKTRQLDCCRAPRRRPAQTARAAWHQGLALGLRCCACCAPLTAALLVVGVMDLGAMAAATAAISLERLAPRGPALARISGVLLGLAGFAALIRAAA
jgi:predicted metal-binding membrane protein